MQSLVLLYDLLRVLGCPYVPEVMGDIANVDELIDQINVTMDGNTVFSGHFLERKAGNFVWLDNQKGYEVTVWRYRDEAIIHVNVGDVDWISLQVPLRPTVPASAGITGYKEWSFTLNDPLLPWYSKLIWQIRHVYVIAAVKSRFGRYITE